jgi:quercetin dioxygenase-like cupin family protein
MMALFKSNLLSGKKTRYNQLVDYNQDRSGEGMIVSHINDLAGIPVQGAEVKGAWKKVLVSPKEGWEGWTMRLFTLEAGGFTPRHTHPWPHINYIAEGSGTLYLDGQEYEITEGSFAYVPGGKLHQFSNNSEETLSFICIVPEEGDK